jgi:hypothetical protein
MVLLVTDNVGPERSGFELSWPAPWCPFVQDLPATAVGNFNDGSPAAVCCPHTFPCSKECVCVLNELYYTVHVLFCYDNIGVTIIMFETFQLYQLSVRLNYKEHYRNLDRERGGDQVGKIDRRMTESNKWQINSCHKKWAI